MQLAACVGFVEESEVDAEGFVGGFGSGDGLEDEVEGRAGFMASIWVVTWARTQLWVGMP